MSRPRKGKARRTGYPTTNFQSSGGGSKQTTTSKFFQTGRGVLAKINAGPYRPSTGMTADKISAIFDWRLVRQALPEPTNLNSQSGEVNTEGVKTEDVKTNGDEVLWLETQHAQTRKREDSIPEPIPEPMIDLTGLDEEDDRPAKRPSQADVALTQEEIMKRQWTSGVMVDTRRPRRIRQP